MFCKSLHIVAFSAAGLHLLALLTSPALAEDLRPAIHVGAEPVAAPAPQYQLDAALASDGTNHLVVWSDGRAGGSNDIYGVRVGPQGDLLDRDGIAVSTASGVQERAAVAFGEEGFFAVWKDDRTGSSDVYGTRIATDGSVLDPDGIAVSAASGGQGYPAIAYGESLYLVVWLDTRDVTSHIYCSRVTVDGTVLDPDGIPVSTAANGQSEPAVAWDGAGFLVAWKDTRGSDEDIYGARVDLDGTVLDPDGIAISTAAGSQAGPCIAFDGTDYLVVWEDGRNGGARDVYGARLQTDGTVLDPGGIQICGQSADQCNTAVSYGGDNWLVVWNDYRSGVVWNVYAARVDSSGAVLDTGGFAVCTDFSQQFNPAMAFADSVYLIAWHDSRNGPKDIYGARVTTSATVLDSSQLISACPSYQSEPALAYCGTGYLAVWQDLRVGSAQDIYGVRIAEDESVLDPYGIAIFTAASDQVNPAAAFGGACYLTVWQDYRNPACNIYGARVTTGGSVLDPSGIAVSTATGAQEYPAVASDGAGFLVVWQDARSGSYDIYGARVTAGGTVLDPSGFVVSGATGDQARPAVAFDGANYLVVWHDLRGGVAYDIYAARVSPGGIVLDPGGIAVSTATNAQENPAVAFDGVNYLAAWQDKRGGPYSDIYASRVGVDGTVLDPAGLAIATASYDQTIPAVAFEGTYYFVAWQDFRRVATRPDIFGVRVDTAGIKLDATALAIAAGDYGQTSPAVVAGVPGQVVIAYSSFTHAPLYGSNRIWANFYGVASGTPVETGDSEAPRLYQNSPNPFSRSTTLLFSLAERVRVTVAIYDVRGRLVVSLCDDLFDPGLHQLIWGGTSSDGRRPAPGIYCCRIEAGDFCASRKMVLIE
jgi:phosphoribosylformylglycinamidine (FGAM) synthase PurS component